MRRLYLQVYLTIVASLVLVVLTAGLLWHFFAGFGPFGQQFEVAGEVIAELVPAANAPAAPPASQRAHARRLPWGHRAGGRHRCPPGRATAHGTARALAARRRIA